MIWYRIRYPSNWRGKLRGWISDHELRERFQLSEDEENLMFVLSENMLAASPTGGLQDLLPPEKTWKPDRIDAAKDHVLAAVSARRHGDAREWERLTAMRPDEWINWLREVARN
jgi:hypothetical protein